MMHSYIYYNSVFKNPEKANINLEIYASSFKHEV